MAGPQCIITISKDCSSAAAVLELDWFDWLWIRGSTLATFLIAIHGQNFVKIFCLKQEYILLHTITVISGDVFLQELGCLTSLFTNRIGTNKFKQMPTDMQIPILYSAEHCATVHIRTIEFISLWEYTCEVVASMSLLIELSAAFWTSVSVRFLRSGWHVWSGSRCMLLSWNGRARS